MRYHNRNATEEEEERSSEGHETKCNWTRSRKKEQNTPHNTHRMYNTSSPLQHNKNTRPHGRLHILNERQRFFIAYRFLLSWNVACTLLMTCRRISSTLRVNSMPHLLWLHLICTATSTIPICIWKGMFWIGPHGNLHILKCRTTLSMYGTMPSLLCSSWADYDRHVASKCQKPVCHCVFFSKQTWLGDALNHCEFICGTTITSTTIHRARQLEHHQRQ